MKDIDFDELDKAVNSLMGGVKKGSDTKDARTLAISPTLKDGEQPMYDKIKQAAEKIGSETITQPTEKMEIITGSGKEEETVVTLPETAEPTVAPASAPAPVPTAASSPVQPVTPVNKQKPSGRFMDVMHPSSDMKTSSEQAPAVTVPPRPVVAPAPEPAPEVPTQQTVAVEPPVVQSDSLASPEPEPKIEVDNSPEVAPVRDKKTVAPVVDNTPLEAVPQPPLTSPFLADAKVEKRPLGGQPNEDVQPPAASVEDFDSIEHPYVSDNSADSQIAPSVTQGELPAELHTDLLAIETAGLSEQAPETENESVEVTPVSTPVQPEETKDKDTTVIDTLAPPTDQGKNEEKVDGAPDGAIYDTSEYHKPVAHPAKRGKEWLLILLVIVIVAICAAGGAAFYLLTSQ